MSLRKYEAHAQELSLQNISNLLWAYAVLGMVPERLAVACVIELKRRLPHKPFTLQQLTNLLWSLCLAQVRLGAPACQASSQGAVYDHSF